VVEVGSRASDRPSKAVLAEPTLSHQKGFEFFPKQKSTVSDATVARRA
jgi:hypothetical protein